MDRRHDHAQVRGHRLAPRDHDHRAFVDLALDAVDAVVGGDDALGKPGVMAGKRCDRIGDLLFGKAAHLGDLLRKIVQLFVVGADDMVGHGSVILGGRQDQPNLPVM